MKIHETYYVCRTGKTKQYYTLYLNRFIVNGAFSKDSCYFVQNLSHNETEAIAKTEDMIEQKRELLRGVEHFSTEIAFSDSKKREYCDLKAFDLKWRKTAKGFIVEIDSLKKEKQEEIWNTWRANKDILKEAGFSIFKGDYCWYFFFRNCTDEEMTARLETYSKNIKEKVISGEYISEPGARDSFVVKINNITEKNTHFGLTRVVNFKTKDDNDIVSFYSGSKTLPEIGTDFILTGTVKSHTEFNGRKQTIVARISWKNINE